jgi:hypothetical protein
VGSKLHKEELQNLYSSSKIWENNLKRMDHALGKLEMHIKFPSENLKERNHFEYLGVDGRTINASSRNGVLHFPIRLHGVVLT